MFTLIPVPTFILMTAQTMMLKSTLIKIIEAAPLPLLLLTLTISISVSTMAKLK